MQGELKTQWMFFILRLLSLFTPWANYMISILAENLLQNFMYRFIEENVRHQNFFIEASIIEYLNDFNSHHGPINVWKIKKMEQMFCFLIELYSAFDEPCLAEKRWNSSLIRKDHFRPQWMCLTGVESWNELDKSFHIQTPKKLQKKIILFFSGQRPR